MMGRFTWTTGSVVRRSSHLRLRSLRRLIYHPSESFSGVLNTEVDDDSVVEQSRAL